MQLENIESELLSLYHEAKGAYRECISNKENTFLIDELNFPLEDITIVEKEVKIVFRKCVVVGHLFEITLGLFHGANEIGKYTLIVNDKKEGVDDILVFY